MTSPEMATKWSILYDAEDNCFRGTDRSGRMIILSRAQLEATWTQLDAIYPQLGAITRQYSLYTFDIIYVGEGWISLIAVSPPIVISLRDPGIWNVCQDLGKAVEEPHNERTAHDG